MMTGHPFEIQNPGKKLIKVSVISPMSFQQVARYLVSPRGYIVCEWRGANLVHWFESDDPFEIRE